MLFVSIVYITAFVQINGRSYSNIVYVENKTCKCLLAQMSPVSPECVCLFAILSLFGNLDLNDDDLSKVMFDNRGLCFSEKGRGQEQAFDLFFDSIHVKSNMSNALKKNVSFLKLRNSIQPLL